MNLTKLNQIQVDLIVMKLFIKNKVTNVRLWSLCLGCNLIKFINTAGLSKILKRVTTYEPVYGGVFFVTFKSGKIILMHY